MQSQWKSLTLYEKFESNNWSLVRSISTPSCGFPSLGDKNKIVISDVIFVGTGLPTFRHCCLPQDGLTDMFYQLRTRRDAVFINIINFSFLGTNNWTNRGLGMPTPHTFADLTFFQDLILRARKLMVRHKK